MTIRERIREWLINALAVLIVVLIVVGFFGLMAFLWWLERVRFVW